MEKYRLAEYTKLYNPEQSVAASVSVLKNFAKFTGKQALGPATLLKRDSSIGAFL